MRAWVCREYRDPFVLDLAELPVPQPGPGQIQIRIAAAGLSFGEMLVLRGTYQKTAPLPYVPSSEMAGVVTALGDRVTRFRVGDRVSAFSIELAGGGLADYAVVPESFAFPVPAALDLVAAAAYPMNYWTAWNALGSRGRLEPGEVLVVHGATGGVGSAAVQIGKARGATVVATGSSAARLALLRDLGADHVIDLSAGDLRDRIRQLTAGRGADVVFDPVGGPLFDDSLRCLAPGGRILVVGFTSGQPNTPRTNVMLVKMISVIGVEARLAIETSDGRGMAEYARMHEAVAAGQLVPQVGRTYAFDAVRTGYRDIEERRHFGKSVVVVAPDLCGAAAKLSV